MRLIDADNLIEDMKKEEKECEDVCTSPTWWGAYSIIERQPTVCDLDEIIKELENLSAQAKARASSLFCDEDYVTNREKQIRKQTYDIIAIAYDKAIQVVRGGVKNGR